MRSYTLSPLPCDHCQRDAADPSRGPALWITDAKVLDFGVPGMIFEPDMTEPRLCDDCELEERTRSTMEPPCQI